MGRNVILVERIFESINGKMILNQILDAAVVGGFIMLNEANNIKGDSGKRRSK